MKALECIQNQKYIVSLPLMALVVFAYAQLSFNVERYEHFQLFTYYGIAFLGGLALTHLLKNKLGLLISLAVLIRLLFIKHSPALSQDFYRFIWDGMLTSEGLNPYLALPKNFLETQQIANPEFGRLLVEKMGSLSASNHTNYPPLAQLIYRMSYSISKDVISVHLLFLRGVNWLAEIGIAFYFWKICRLLKLKKYLVFFVLLNPLVILEITGNLHFEAVMLFFFVAFLHHLLRNSSPVLISIFLACAVLAKLIPLIVCPLILTYQFWPQQNRRNFKKSFKIIALTGLFITLGFLSFIDKNLLTAYQSSLSLWFQKFEFNASFYYLFREIGYGLVGYNAIGIIGKTLALSIFCLVIFTSLYKYQNNKGIHFLQRLVYILSIYLLLSTTIHPWYLILPLSVSLLINHKMYLVWSGVVILSYYAYHKAYFEENLWIVFSEYAIVLLLIGCRNLKPFVLLKQKKSRK
ncbi:MAG: polyprenol phosphomannose-dependent alpha 1,6 mannosyltransferase MptB [Psychroflexus sp.]|nr:polyprenol phosphomannose-dependent alpha 1,6 mannosyltransferase MptB [Psychroflexus sp.]MDN6309032.1 polyprenol phosphomannose-dependent alpha 1,6 mannosyltransferase MptB [Psychroflexus sp.]